MGCVKLYVCCHKDVPVPNHPLLVPVQVGVALSEKRFKGFLQDDEGENISAWNRSYCELTAQYWAWKNEDADYYGFFHYRRYLYPDAFEKRPYRIWPEFSRDLLDKLGYDGFEELIRKYDVIVPKGEDMHVPVWKHYAEAPFHHKEDLALIEKIIREKWPEYVQSMETYLSGTVCYFGNIYIMRREIFYKYCEWLFAVLHEFDDRADLTGYSAQELRVDGYLAERLLGIYLACHQNGLRIMELPRAHRVPEIVQRWRMKMICTILPPGSRRRAWVKHLSGK